MSRDLDPSTPAIACMANAAFAPYAGLLLHAIARHFSGPRFSFHLLDYGCTPDQRRRMERVARAQRPDIDLVWHERQTAPVDGTRAGFSALCRDRLLFLQTAELPTGRILMLDVDILIEADLLPLCQADLNGKALGAVRDFAYPTVGARFADSASPDKPYFNLGVILVDLPRWRACDRLGPCLAAWPPMPPVSEAYFPDQDAFNRAWPELGEELDPTWNAQMIALQHHDKWPASAWKETVRPRRDELFNTPCVRHWPGPFKPWQNHPGCEIPFQARYREALRAYAWSSRLERALGRLRRAGTGDGA